MVNAAFTCEIRLKPSRNNYAPKLALYFWNGVNINF